MVTSPPDKGLEARAPALSTDQVYTLPNLLTALRFVFAVLLFVLIAFGAWVGCLVVFALAAVTDWLDGFLARRWGHTSSVGRNLDPMADKVLTCGAFIFLLPYGERDGWLVPWMVTVVVVRELLITGLRSFLEAHGAKFGADWLGKLKMGLQCAALIAIFVAFLGWDPASYAAEFFATARSGLIYAMLAATVLSALQYLSRAFLILQAATGKP